MIHSRTAGATALVLGALLALAGSHRAEAQTTSSADANFATRCGAPGVLVCQGFDTSSLFTYSSSQTEGLYPIYGTTTLGGFQDTTIKASGASSLRFNIPGNTGADMAGNFSWNFGQNFSQNSTFYVQYQARFDQNYVGTNWGTLANTSPKLAIFYDQNGSSCANIELTTVEYYGNPMPIMYSDCGSFSLYGSTTSLGSYSASTPLDLQEGSSTSSGYNCPYGNETTGTGNGVGCFYYPANTWITFYYKVSVGNWGQPNSSVQAWVAVNGGPYQQFVNIKNYTLNDDGNSAGGFSRIMLTPYMTGKSSSISYATAHVWYDELIVSTQPIAAPDEVLPSSPGNVAVK
jgi:hypothetical protein